MNDEEVLIVCQYNRLAKTPKSNLVTATVSALLCLIRGYSRYYADTCNEWRGPSPRFSVWTPQKRHSGNEPLATVYNLTSLGFEPIAPKAMSLTTMPTGLSILGIRVFCTPKISPIS